MIELFYPRLGNKTCPPYFEMPALRKKSPIICGIDVFMVHPVYLVACMREANSELLARSRMRDGWLRLHLFAQAAILGLALGIRTDLSISVPAPVYAALSPTLSLMFCLFYGVQDDLVAGLSRYIASLTSSNTRPTTQNWHGSTMLRDYYSRGWAPKMKLAGLTIAFVVIPGILAGYWLTTASYSEKSFWVAVLLTSTILLGSAFVCIASYIRRGNLGRRPLVEP